MQISLLASFQKQISGEVRSEINARDVGDAKHTPICDFTRQIFVFQHNENKYQINHVKRHPERKLLNWKRSQ